jgi:replication initiation and membrane attachment protein DnaB
MNQLIAALLQQLRPALRSVAKAEHLLNDYWADKIALLWTTKEVHRAANESKTVLTEQQARTILRDLLASYHQQYGLEWQDVIEAVKQSGLGRDIKERELHRFIHHDVLAVDPPTKKESSCPTGVKIGSAFSGRKQTSKSSSS